MSGILDKLNKELEQFGRRAQAALDEGKLQLERMRLRREQDEAPDRQAPAPGSCGILRVREKGFRCQRP